MEKQAVQGYPSKSFFIDMLTRDIKVGDSILDLMDNSIDSAVAHSAVEVMQLLQGVSVGDGLKDYWIHLKYGDDGFSLKDNCGGIPADEARDRIFLLGNSRRLPEKDAGGPTRGGLSVYGIGMKRAFFKLGNYVDFRTQTSEESFDLKFDVEEWRDKGDKDWEFGVARTGKPRKSMQAGTEIEVTQLHSDVKSLFSTKAFESELVRRVATTYALFIEAGLQIKLNGTQVPSTLPSIGEGPNSTARRELEFEGVRILVVTGLTPREDRTPRGTYVFCNGRMVLDADRSKLTGWGSPLPQWHSKFGHFVGYLYFQSSDVEALPWTTTKQGVVFESRVYQHALAELQLQTRPVLSFLTRLYPGDVEEEGIPEREVLDQLVLVPVTAIRAEDSSFRLRVQIAQSEPTVKISFERPTSEVDLIKKCYPRLKSARAIAVHAFERLLKECQ